MPYLARLVLNPTSPAVQRDLGDCHAMHCTVMSAFPDALSGGSPRAACQVLFRVETNSYDPILLVQSAMEPNWLHLKGGYLSGEAGGVNNPACKQIDHIYERLTTGTVLTFRLRANPTRKINTRSSASGDRRNGQRVPVRGHEELLTWLERKAHMGGFELLSAAPDCGVPDVREVYDPRAFGWRGPRGSRIRLTFNAVTFDGRLRVTDPDRFRDSLLTGIGSGKAYGFGLLSIAPA